MEILETIHNRRSIRKFSDEPVTEQEITTLLQAAMTAPSAGNARPWRFIVVTKRETLDTIAEVHPYAKMCKTAQVAIIICADTSAEKHVGYWPQDCAAATQNLLLAAQGTGLGAVWCGLYPNKDIYPKFAEMFGLPEGVIPMAMVPVGHPNQPSGPKDRFEAEYIHSETW